MNTALQVAQRQAAATAGQGVELWYYERIDLARVIKKEIRSLRDRRIEFVKATPVDDPGARQHRNRDRTRWRIGRQITDDLARGARKGKLEIKRRRYPAVRSEDAVVAIDLANHAVAQTIGGSREFD